MHVTSKAQVGTAVQGLLPAAHNVVENTQQSIDVLMNTSHTAAVLHDTAAPLAHVLQ